MSMNIDIECIGLLSLILQDSPKDRQLILCVLARANTVPTRIIFKPNTDYPTFYGYTNSRIPFYLMGKGVLSNVPREGYAKRLISSHYLAYAETIINRAKNWDIHQKGMSVSKFITLDNKTSYKDAEVFLVFRDKALDYIKGYATLHKEEFEEIKKEDKGDEKSKQPKYLSPSFPLPPASQELRGAEKGMRDLHRQSFENQRHRESLKQQRILATQIDKYTHALNTILEWAEHHGDGKSFSLDYYYFNFEDRMDDSKMLERFLDRLKDAGCFKSWRRTNYSGGTRFGFIEVNLDKLKSYTTAYQEQNKSDATTDLQRQSKSAHPSNRELRKKLNNIIKTGKFGGKEKAFLRFLAKDFEPKTIKEISDEVSTDACKNLKFRVKKKIKNTGFSIETIRADRWGGKSQYQLKYLTAAESS